MKTKTTMASAANTVTLPSPSESSSRGTRRRPQYGNNSRPGLRLYTWPSFMGGKDDPLLLRTDSLLSSSSSPNNKNNNNKHYSTTPRRRKINLFALTPTLAHSPPVRQRQQHYWKRQKHCTLPLLLFIATVTLLSTLQQRILLHFNNMPHQRLVTTANTNNNNNHTHAIPNILIFTHKYNLLQPLNDTLSLLLLPLDYNNDEALRQELTVLQQNVQHTIQLHETAHVRFLTDTDCQRSLQHVAPHLFPNNNNTSMTATELLSYFQNEPVGMYKADLCRGAALWETGGLYTDTDLGVRFTLWQAIRPSTQFVTNRVHVQSKQKGAFFQAFIGVSPQHEIMRRYIELFVEYYRNELPEYEGRPLGVVLLKRAFDEVVPNHHHHDDTIQIWQEVLYPPQLHETLLSHVPPPVWGTRRACKFIVVSSDEKTLPVEVPFYSRIGGSRMCPVHHEESSSNAGSSSSTSG